ncbi:MAG: hypothetical protein B9S34_07520 [Opitutia bacterium Tous-C1TDCM]|nr:MAG: hypothetical protein B9S34_07520 [Opitutae bacterium Tous-C1TDCM]
MKFIPIPSFARLAPLVLLAVAPAAFAQQPPDRRDRPPAQAPVAPPLPPTPAAPAQNQGPQNPGPQNRNPPAANPPAQPGPGFGQPLAGLTDAQLIAFTDGRADFVEAETPADGLGPIFNDVSCVACHRAPAVGGASRSTVTRFGRITADGFDPLAGLGGSLLQNRSVRGVPQERVPAEANVVARRVTTPLFGAGLIEAIPDATLENNALAGAAAGVGGKVAWIEDAASGTIRAGRFGWKAQHASLLAFSGDAYNNEMGITNRLFPHENAPNGNTAAIAGFVRTELEDVIDPVDGKDGIDRAADFMQLLAPPPRGAITAGVLAGEQTFRTVGCASCHTPVLTTGRHAVAALSEKPVALYSDLLLHDMGSLGDGIVQGPAGGREMRTAPLWGLRARNALLHDGRANTVDAAIRAHDGEAAVARDNYAQLDPVERQQLLAFLGSL